ncbi:hypothetical protein EDD21DRAFT_408230 [Dissophora ornata]|nr:hypothetical protein EDD21DRAFT_408230 [Dissophora ornata]
MEPEYQYFCSQGTLVRVQVTHNPSTGLKYVFWGDLRLGFPGIVRVQDGDTFIPFMRCPREYRLKPFRIEYVPDTVLDIVYKDKVGATVSSRPTTRTLKSRNLRDDTNKRNREEGASAGHLSMTTPPAIEPLEPPPEIAMSVRRAISSYLASLPPSQSPSLSYSPSPPPRTPGSSVESLEEEDISLVTSSVGPDETPTLKPIETPMVAKVPEISEAAVEVTLEEEEEEEIATALAAVSPNSPTLTPSDSVSHTLPVSPPHATVTSQISSEAADTASPYPKISSSRSLPPSSSTTPTSKPTPVSYAFDHAQMSNEAKLNTVMSLVKGLSLQVAGSVSDSDVQSAAVKHSVKLSDIGSLLPGAKRTNGVEMFLSSAGVLTMKDGSGEDGVDWKILRDEGSQNRSRGTSAGEIKNGGVNHERGTAGEPEHVREHRQEPVQQPSQSEPKQVSLLQLLEQQHLLQSQQQKTSKLPQQKQQKQKQKAKNKQRSASTLSASSISASPSSPPPAPPSNTPQTTDVVSKVDDSSSPSNASSSSSVVPLKKQDAKLGRSPISTFPGAMPLLMQSGILRDYGSVNDDGGYNGTSAISDAIAGYRDVESSAVLSLLSAMQVAGSPPSQQLVQAEEEARAQVLPDKILASTGRLVKKSAAPAAPDTEEYWTEMRQLLRVFYQAASRSNLWLADKIGLQLDNRFEDLERRAALQPELRERTQPFLDMFQLSQETIAPARLKRRENRARELMEQRHTLAESLVPPLFVILPESADHQQQPVDFRVYFLCQCQNQEQCSGSSSVHTSGESQSQQTTSVETPSHFGHLTKHRGYELVFDQQLVLMCGTYMYEILDIIKHGVTLDNVLVDIDDNDDEESESREKERAQGGEQSSEIQDDRKQRAFTIPPLNPRGTKDEVELYYRVNAALEHILNNRCVDTVADSQKTFLRTMPGELKLPCREEPLGGLYRVLSSKGTARWVCADHYNSLPRIQRMSAFVKLIEGQGGVPLFWEQHLGQVQVLLPSRSDLDMLLNILTTLRAPVQDLGLMIDWEMSFMDMEKLFMDLHALPVNIHGIRICLGKGVIPTEAAVFELRQSVLIASMIIRSYIHLFVLEDATPLQELCDAKTRLFVNRKEYHYDNWERYPHTRAVIVKNAQGLTKFSLRVENTGRGLLLVDRYFNKEEHREKLLVALQLFASADDALNIFYKDGVIIEMHLSASGSSSKKLLLSDKIEGLDFKIRTPADRPKLEAILKRNPNLCELDVRCPIEMLPEMFTLLKKWRKDHGKLPSLRIECKQTKLWWVQELFECEPPSIELSAQEPTGLGPILELAIPEVRIFEGPLTDVQVVFLMNAIRKKGTKLSELDLDISYFTAAGFESVHKLLELCQLQMLGVTISSRLLVSKVGARGRATTVMTTSLDWDRIAAFLSRIRLWLMNLQFVGPDINIILQNLLPKADLTQLVMVKKLELFGGKGVFLDPTTGLPVALLLLSKIKLWNLKLVDLNIDAKSWDRILSAIDFQKLAWLEIRQCGFGPAQLTSLADKMPKNSSLQKLHVHMALKPTSEQLQAWRPVLAKKTVRLNFLCDMDERTPDEIGVRIKEAKY